MSDTPEWSVEIGPYVRLPHGWCLTDQAGIYTAFVMKRGRWYKAVRPVALTGFWAGPRMWFRSMRRRREIATKRLMAVAAEIDERQQRAKALRLQQRLEARRKQGRKG